MSEDTQTTRPGWTNYETWCVSEWLPTDETVWSGFREQLRRMATQRTTASDESNPSLAAKRRMQKCELAKQLRDAVSRLGYMELPLIYCDLLESGLARVNWLEIVEHFLSHPFPKQLRRAAAPVDALTPVFDAGHIITGSTAQERLAPEEIKAALVRHLQGDWGILDADDRRQNLRALAAGRSLQSVYESANGINLWVVTEADRSLTSVLLAEDY